MPDGSENRSIEFDESQLSSLSGLAQQLFSDTRDPTSPAYKRVHVRPRINWLAVAANCILPLVAAVLLGILLKNLGAQLWLAILLPAAAVLLYTVLRLKSIVLCCVRIYQRYAPEAIRNKCRFEPSCSCYMIAAIEQYGLITGGKKGIARLKRCKPGFGGFDPP